MNSRRLIAVLIGLNVALLGAIAFQQIGNLTSRESPGDGLFVRAADGRTANVFAVDPEQSPFVIAANKVSPAVVSIGGTVSRVTWRPDPFFEGFLWRGYGRRAEQVIEIPFLASGFLIDRKGHLVTNVHVIEKARNLFATLNDGRRVNAKLLDQDNRVDVALLKADLSNAPFAPMGNSDALSPGQWVLAIGNPYGDSIPDPRPTVTAGVVGALHRNYKAQDIDHERIYLDMIQTDASINPGNSGGPLVNLAGEIVGMSTFIVSRTGGSVGLGFAIPINRVRSVVDEILKHGRVRNYVMDFSVIDLTAYVARWLGVSTELKGAVVQSIERARGPAAKAGLEPGDIILQADQLRVTSRNDLLNYFLSLQVGTTIEFKVLRDDKERVIRYQIEESRRP